jgi:predicted AAA+ superfamily ATPase
VRSRLEKLFLEYLAIGGFPEVQEQDAPVRTQILQGYVDTVLLRDIVERYSLSQVAALRWLARHCLRNPGGATSLHRIVRDLGSQGLGIGNETAHELFDHLLDSFLIATTSLSTESERQRNSNPRKVYPADVALIRAFDATGRANLGHALETVVFNELLRRGGNVSYMKTPGGFEIDFHVHWADGREELIQVCADPTDATVLERELRALADADVGKRRVTRRLLVATHDLAPPDPPDSVRVRSTCEWLLDRDED